MTTLLMKAQKAWQKAKRPKSAKLLAAESRLTQTAYWALAKQDETDMDLIRGIKAMRAVVTRAGPSAIQFISEFESAMRSPLSIEFESKVNVKIVPPPVRAPAGWPPGEEPATVVTPDGLRAVEQRQYPLGGTPLPENGEFSKAWLSANYAKCGNKPWQCCTCGTHYPPDPCIPGAYF